MESIKETPEKSKKTFFKKRYFFLIGILVLIFILLRIDLNVAFSILMQANISLLIASFTLQLLNTVIKSEKWRLLVTPFSKSYNRLRCAEVWMIGYGIGIITPGRVGDFTRAVYLKKDLDISYGKSVATVFIDRLQDIIALFVLSYMGLILFNPLLASKPEIRTMISVATILFAVIGVFILRKNSASMILRPFFNRFIREGQKRAIKSNYDDFYAGIKLIVARKKIIAMTAVLTSISWAIILAASYTTALSVGIEAEFVYFIFLIPIINIIELIPISLSGVGTRDSAAIILFSLIGIAQERAFIFSSMILITNMLFAMIGLILMQRKPVK